jgi:hypothetical protein
VNRIPRQPDKSSGKMAAATGNVADEAKLRNWIRMHKNGTLREIFEEENEYKLAVKQIEAFQARNQSTDTLAPRSRVQSDKAKKISADIEARKKEESQRAQPKQLVGQGLKRFARARGKSSSDESSGDFSSSDDDKNSVPSKETPLIAAEDEGNAKQETGEKKLSTGIFSLLGSLLDGDDMENLDKPAREVDSNSPKSAPDDMSDLC